MFTWREEFEDPGTRKVSEGGTTLRLVYIEKFRSAFSPCVAQAEKVREGIKNGGRQKQKFNLDPSALFTGVNNYLSAELSQ